MIFLAGLFLIGLIALAGLACLRVAAGPTRNGPAPGRRRPPRPAVITGYALLAVSLVILLFRPDEEIASGEDAGAYFLVAQAVAARQKLVFPDSGLVELPVEERSLFRYGHPGFLLTKDAVLWAGDPGFSQVGPHFLPAYSILLAVPAVLGFPYAGFWTSPVFAILIGGLLALLAVRLTGRRPAGWLAFALFIFNPAVFWNARCLRAEWPAAFLALAGIILWLSPVLSRKRLSPVPGFLGGLVLSAAASFHVTAFFVLIPAVLASLYLTRRNAFWTAWWSGLLLGCGIFLAQVIWVTDPYRLRDVWGDPGRRNTVLLASGVVLSSVAGLRWLRRRLRKMTSPPSFSPGRLAGGLFSLGYLLAVFLLLRGRDDQGLIPGLPAWTATYLGLTDFSGVRLIFSRVGFGAALAGLVVLGIGSGTPGRLGRRIFFLLAPAGLVIGWMDNYMFETRRMVTFLVPLLVLSTVSLLAAVGVRGAELVKRRFPALSRMVETGLPCLLTVLLLAAAVRGRGQLYTTWNNRGSYRFYRALAGAVREEGDFLVAEYTQTAVPLEKLSGLPLLPIAWGYRSEAEYRQAERVLARLIREHPERRHLLVSPFSGAAVPGAGAEPLFSRTLETGRLARAARTVPSGVIPFRLTLRLYRLHPPGRTDLSGTYVRIMDHGTLGLAGGANHFIGWTIRLRGVPLPVDPAGGVRVPLPAGRGEGSLFFVVAFPGTVPEEEPAEGGFTALPAGARRFPLGPGWQGVELKLPAGEEPVVELDIRAERSAYLTDLFWMSGPEGSVRRVHPLETKTEFRMEEIDFQWLRASSSVSLPAGPSPRRLWLLAASGREEKDAVRAAIRPRGGGQPEFTFPVEKDWKWNPIPLPPSAPSGFVWYDLEFTPAWDPGLSNYPPDLGILVHRLAVVPETGR